MGWAKDETAHDVQIDDTFTGLQGRLLQMFSAKNAEIERLRDALVTIRVNALEIEPNDYAPFVRFCDVGVAAILRGSSISDAMDESDQAA